MRIALLTALIVVGLAAAAIPVISAAVSDDAASRIGAQRTE